MKDYLFTFSLLCQWISVPVQTSPPCGFLMQHTGLKWWLEIHLNASRWPRTLAGIRVELPCNRLRSSAGAPLGGSGRDRQAWRYCSQEGHWAEEDYSQCQFQKEATRFLFVINQVKLELTSFYFPSKHYLTLNSSSSYSYVSTRCL